MVQRGQRWDIESKIKELVKIKSRVPVIIANQVEKHILKSWDDEAFSDGSPKSNPWEKRKVDPPGARRGILIGKGTGILRGSIQAKSKTWRKIEVGSYGIEYAKYHNRGIPGRLPKRQFIGESTILRRKILKIINVEFKKLKR